VSGFWASPLPDVAPSSLAPVDLLRFLLQRSGVISILSKGGSYLLHGRPTLRRCGASWPETSADALWERVCRCALARLRADWRSYPRNLWSSVRRHRSHLDIDPTGPEGGRCACSATPEGENWPARNATRSRAVTKACWKPCRKIVTANRLACASPPSGWQGRRSVFGHWTYWEGETFDCWVHVEACLSCFLYPRMSAFCVSFQNSIGSRAQLNAEEVVRAYQSRATNCPDIAGVA